MMMGDDTRTTAQLRRDHAKAKARFLASVRAMQDAGHGEMRWTDVIELFDSGRADATVREYHHALREEAILAQEITYRTGVAP